MRVLFSRRTTACLFGLLIGAAVASAACSKPSQQAPQPAGTEPAATSQPGGTGAPPPAAAPTGQPGAPATVPAEPAPPPPRTYTLAEGAVLTVRTVSTLSTDAQAAGNTFKATLAEPIVEGDWVVAREGADVEGVVVAATKGGRVKGTAQLEVAITGLTLSDGRRIRLETSMAGAAAKSEKKKDIGKVGIAAGAGAIIGGIAGGGKGAAIGAAVGGGGGTAVVMGTRGGPAVIRAGSELRFTVKTPVEITERK